SVLVSNTAQTCGQVTADEGGGKWATELGVKAYAAARAPAAAAIRSPQMVWPFGSSGYAVPHVTPRSCEASTTRCTRASSERLTYIVVLSGSIVSHGRSNAKSGDPLSA